MSLLPHEAPNRTNPRINDPENSSSCPRCCWVVSLLIFPNKIWFNMLLIIKYDNLWINIQTRNQFYGPLVWPSPFLSPYFLVDDLVNTFLPLFSSGCSQCRSTLDEFAAGLDFLKIISLFPPIVSKDHSDDYAFIRSSFLLPLPYL